MFQINAVLLNFLFTKETWKQFYSAVFNIILKNVFCESNKNIRIISEGSCDESDYAKNSAFKSQ